MARPGGPRARGPPDAARPAARGGRGHGPADATSGWSSSIRLAVDFDDIVADRSALAAADGRRRGLRPDAPGPLLRADHRLAPPAPRPFLLWCHLGSLGTTWDAPLGVPPALLDRGRPASRRARPRCPTACLAEDPDPDEVLGFAQAYAGQVSLLDTCLGGLWEALGGTSGRQGDAARADLRPGLSAGRAPPAGARATKPSTASWSTCRSVLRFPDGLGAAARSQALVEPADLWATLLDCWRARRRPARLRPPASAAGPRGGRRCCATGWCSPATAPSGPSAPRPGISAWPRRAELFVKPDDRWEVNNVAVRCLEVVECLEDAWASTSRRSRPAVTDLPPLAKVLVEGAGVILFQIPRSARQIQSRLLSDAAGTCGNLR